MTPFRCRPFLRLALFLVWASCLGRSDLGAQAGSVIRGTVTRSDGRGSAGTLVLIRNEADGREYRQFSGANGQFRFEGLEPGRYRLEARPLGAPVATLPPLSVRLGQQLRVDISLGADQVARLPELKVEDAGAFDPGPAYAVPAEAVGRLPLLNRDFVGLFAVVPQALGRDAFSISGQHPRSNAIRIDGAIANDVFGVGRTPGSVAGAKAISIEAVSEFRVSIAPFDTRHGGFSGGLIEAITRSGDNRFRATAFVSARRPELVGRGPNGEPADAFSFAQYGFTASGPIRRDRLHFFLATDLQSSRTPYAGPDASDPVTGISVATAERIRTALRGQFGFDPGGAAPPTLTQPDRSVFGKLSWHAGRHQADLSATWVDASGDLFDRVSRSRNNAGGWMLSTSGARQQATVGGLRLRVVSAGDRWRHEARLALQRTDETRASNHEVPLFLVQGDVPGNFVAGGSLKNAQGTSLRQRQAEFSSLIGWTGGVHQINVGTQVDYFHFRDDLFIGRWGVWTFPSVAALERAAPIRYEVGLPGQPGSSGPVADFGVATVALHGQDRVALSDRLEVAAGVRLETTLIDGPPTNPDLATSAALDRLDTGRFPSGNLMVLPRLSGSFRVDRRTVVRAGLGGFASRPAYAWLANAFASTGREQRLLVCTAVDGVPDPVADVTRLPTTCRTGTPRVAPPTVTAVDPGLRFPTAFKALVGVDRVIGGVAVALDLVHTRTHSALTLVDRNLSFQRTSAEGRAMYGTIEAFGTPRPARRDGAGFGAVYQYRNGPADRSTAVMVSATKTWPSGALVQLGYQWSKSEDRVSINGFVAPLVFQQAPVDGTIEDRRLTRSAFDVPHSLTAVGLVPLPGRVMASLTLRAQSGRPYAYVVNGDANADSVTLNDLVYVPRSVDDMSLTNSSAYAELDRFIESEGCLRRQRGRIMARNSCRNPGFVTVDARFGREFRLGRGHRIDATVDVFNLLNLIDRDWGWINEASDREQRPLLLVDGWDAAKDRPMYRVPVQVATGAPSLPALGRPLVDLSRWRVQMGLRYRF
ncbi:MAG: carboxypeptidase regulatory-like domain-containing protein [Gemmatimonadales bacterium]|nr:carboxypeptidase regulatory-like domain-containing protein [Gemmatimonadales bacterium]